MLHAEFRNGTFPDRHDAPVAVCESLSTPPTSARAWVELIQDHHVIVSTPKGFASMMELGRKDRKSSKILAPSRFLWVVLDHLQRLQPAEQMDVRIDALLQNTVLEFQPVFFANLENLK